MSSITSGYCWHKTFFSNEHIWWTGVINFFCDFYSYGWLLSLFKDYLYSMKFNMGNWICCWICMYSTSLTVISVPVPVVHPFSYRACKTFWFPIHMNYINHACTLIDSIILSFSTKSHLMWDIYPTTLNTIQGDSGGKSIFLEMIVSVIVRENVHINVSINQNGCRAGAIWIHKYKNIVHGNKETEITIC